LNHFPTIGTVVALGLLAAAMFTRSVELKRASLVIVLLIAIVSIAAYVTGNAAEEILADTEEPSAPLVARHEDAAMLALIFMEIAGAIAWFGLWNHRRRGVLRESHVVAAFLVALVSLGLMSRAAALGGDIVHAEIREAPALAAMSQGEDVVGWVDSMGLWVIERTWVWPAAEALHFIGLWMLFAIVLIVNLRMVGFLRGIPYSALHRLLPWAVLSFAMNVVTGMLFFIAAPSQYTQNVSFHAKIVLMVVAGSAAIYYTIFDDVWSLDADSEARLSSKVIAVSTTLLWLGVIYFGRMLPFLGNAF
jgi:hypothetical protein